MREGACIPDEWQLQVLPDGSFSDSSVSRVLACLPLDARPAAQAAITQLPQIMQFFENEHRQQPLRLPPPQSGWGHGFDSCGSNLPTSSDSSVPSGSSLRVVQDGRAYAQPGMAPMQQVAPVAMLPQHKHQPQDAQLQYGHACGLGSTASPQQHGLAGVAGPGQAAQMQQPMAMVPAAAAPGMSPAGYMQGGILQPAVSLASSGWAQVQQPAAMQYGVLSSAGVVNPPLMYLQGNVLMSAQGEVYAPAMHPQQGPAGHFQQQAAYMQPAQGPVLPQQQLDPQGLPQQQNVMSVPMSNAMLVRLQQQLQSPAQPQLQPSQALVVSAAAAPGVGLYSMPQQQSLSSSMGDQLVQQLHALGLDSLHVAQQL
jgi:hypothetical protein